MPLSALQRKLQETWFPPPQQKQLLAATGSVYAEKSPRELMCLLTAPETKP